MTEKLLLEWRRLDYQRPFERQELLESFVQQTRAGTLKMSRSEFDITMLQEDREITHNLIEAEKEYSGTMKWAVACGVIEHNDGRSSKFVDDKEDDPRLEIRHIIVNRSQIERWIEQVELIEEGEIPWCEDEYEDDQGHDAVALVELGESMSGIAEWKYKRRIEKWDRLRQAHWQETREAGIPMLP